MDETITSMGELDNQAVVIERAVSTDAEAVYEVQRQTWIDTYPNAAAGITIEDVRTRIEGKNGELVPKNIARWREGIETSGTSREVFVARLHGKVVAFIAPGTINGQRRIGALYVLPEAQRNGVGGELMNQALKWHGRQEDIYLRVADYNQDAIDFYTHFGFTKTDRSIEDEDAIRNGQTPIPEIEMVLPASTQQGA